MKQDLGAWVKKRANTVFLSICASLLALSVTSLVMALSPGDQASSAEQAAGIKAGLVEDKEGAEGELATRHSELLAELGGIDADRIKRDRRVIRTFVLSLAEAPASSRSVRDEQISLDARWDVLGPDSRTLTEFTPEWMATGEGRHYRLTDLDIQVAGISGLDYSYAALARLEPDEDGAQFVFVTATTKQDGALTEAVAYRASNASRAGLEAADGSRATKDESAEPTIEPSAGDGED
ncbi:hypothetical protein [Nocardiopsis sp. JB363]|uniref:hypothetical protein n=1 Tax=Nocardiopsis sp. JB363 TaxID=1434837 RepID=UPI00097A1430|nr:hypothetical protein [Nocardiopsis sp. JB363]SIO86932.1 hypothetical protein BQ8420_14345 [Nocardiopsis sp. JB363]